MALSRGDQQRLQCDSRTQPPVAAQPVAGQTATENDDPQRQAEVNAEKWPCGRPGDITGHGQLLLLRQMGLSYAELATACDMNPASVGKTLSRAADAFRAAYLAATEG